MLRAKETVFLQVTGAVLIEPRVAPGTYTGGSNGVSFRIAKGVSYRVGQNRGTYQPGPTNPTPIDTGEALISSERVLFRGTKATREWAFAKLLGYTHSDTDDWTALQVSNRQAPRGSATAKPPPHSFSTVSNGPWATGGEQTFNH